MAMLENGEAEMITQLIRLEDRIGHFLWADTAYQTDYYALLSHSTYRDLDVSEIVYARVGLITGAAYAEMFHAWFPDHPNTVEYPNTLAAFDALERNEIDLLMATSNLLLSLTNYLERPGFKINLVFTPPYESRFGFRLNERVLSSIVTKALSLVDTESLSVRWTHQGYDYHNKITQAQVPWLIGVSCLLFCVLALLFAMLLRRSQEQKRLEKTVQERTEQLEIQTRSAQIASEAAQKASESALAASKSKSDFLTNMSHEMRTPMNAIIGMTVIAKDSSDIQRKDYCLNKIDDASNHLLGVINDILDMSKIEANKFELSFSEFDFEDMLQRIVGVINLRIEEKQQFFMIHIDKNIPQILIGDDQRLAQVIMNLLSNAIKFTPEKGTVRLDAHLLKKEDSMCTIQVKVTDTGIGINEEQQLRLFNSFEQASRNTSRNFGGTGLGLAISKQIVEMMGGQIGIESELGKGAAFFFTVQLMHVSEEQKSLLDPSVNWTDMRILVVDHAPDVLKFFEHAAYQLGIGCDITDNGGEACGLIKRDSPYAICFIDWKLPGMSATELTGRIKSNLPNTLVIIMASMIQWAIIEDEAKNAGMDGFLSKPLFTSNIADCINEYCGAHKPSQKTRISKNDHKADFEGYRIILAEDIEINQEIVLSLLKPTALSIDCAKNGAEAVQLFLQNPDYYDMIFMDIQMPEMDGHEATRRIRSLNTPKARQIPIVAMTANVFREDVEKCLESGMNNHIGKPLNLDEMLAKLYQYLPKR
jgi:signal transduction histidine kinase/CheY-like chemotaxis protein